MLAFNSIHPTMYNRWLKVLEC